MISDYLSKEERFMCIKQGALAYAGHQDVEHGPLQKEAGPVTESAALGVGAAKALMVLSAIGAGVPLGVFSHVMGRRISGKRIREEELKEKIKLYQTAADEMAHGLANGQ